MFYSKSPFKSKKNVNPKSVLKPQSSCSQCHVLALCYCNSCSQNKNWITIDNLTANSAQQEGDKLNSTQIMEENEKRPGFMETRVGSKKSLFLYEII